MAAGRKPRSEQSDTYSTGQTLFMLLKTGTAADHPAIVRARDYLLKTQHADGSWLAISHVSSKRSPTSRMAIRMA